MGMGMQLYGALSTETMLAIRDHVVAVEDVLREILAHGVATGQFGVDGEPATMSLIHACVAPRHLPVEAIERFVLRALGATL